MDILFKEIYKKPYMREIMQQLPFAPEAEEIEIKHETIAMADGVNLVCHIAMEKNNKRRLPVIVTRTPYGIKSLRFFFEMAFYGYACVAVECRGTGGSGGKWEPSQNEKQDGIDTLNFIINKPWCNKKIGLTGSSYLSMCQWILGDCLPKEVKTLNIENYSPYRYSMLYTDRMFHLEAYGGWAAYNTGLDKTLCPKENLYDEILGFKPQIKMDEVLLGQKLPWYRKWITSANESDPYWKEGVWGQLYDMPEKINIPVLLHSGWYDPHLSGMLRAWNELAEETREKSLFIIAPQNHKQSACGDMELKNTEALCGRRFAKSRLIWFNRLLKDGAGVETGKIIAYKYGSENWQEFKAESKTTTMFIDVQDRRLTFNPSKSGETSYVYNPNNPVLTCGSEVIMTDYMYHKNKKTTEGIRLIPPVGSRNDVISFVSDKLNDTINISGRVHVYIAVKTTAPDTAFTAKLSVVRQGASYALRSGITTIAVQKAGYSIGEAVTIKITLPEIFIAVNKGEALRLDISSSDYPAFHVHPNTLTPWAREDNYTVAVQTICGGKVVF